MNILLKNKEFMYSMKEKERRVDFYITIRNRCLLRNANIVYKKMKFIKKKDFFYSIKISV
jgi:hypothetical protein